MCVAAAERRVGASRTADDRAGQGRVDSALRSGTNGTGKSCDDARFRVRPINAPTVRNSDKRLEQRTNARDSFGSGSQMIWSAPPWGRFRFTMRFKKYFAPLALVLSIGTFLWQESRSADA